MPKKKSRRRGDHLLLRSNTWFFRRGVPEALQGLLGREIVRTLKTGDVVEARKRSRVHNAEVERIFQAAREGVVKGSGTGGAATTSDTTERLLAQVCAQFTHDSLLDDRRERRLRDDVEAGDWNLDRGEIQELYAERFEAGELPTAEAVEALKRQGLELTPGQFEALVREMRHALISTRGLVERDRDADNRGEPRLELPRVPMSEEAISGAPAIPTGPPLAKAMATYTAEKTSTGVWTERVAHESATVLDAFVGRVGGDRAVVSVVRDEVREWRDVALRSLKPGTVRTRVKSVSAFFRWCVAEGHIASNPVQGLAPKAPSKRSGETKRAYTCEDLRKLFGPELTATRGKRDDHFWVPLVALYSGARVSEVAQLAPEDVVKRSGVVCIEIRTLKDGQRLKNEASERTVPVHSDLLRLGLAEYAKERRATGEKRLFPNVALGTRGRPMGARIVGWWPRWVKNFEGISANTSFHSLRHGVAQALIAADVPEVVAKQLLGHSDTTQTTGTYGRRLDVKQLAAAIEKLDFSAEVHALRVVGGE